MIAYVNNVDLIKFGALIMPNLLKLYFIISLFYSTYNQYASNTLYYNFYITIFNVLFPTAKTQTQPNCLSMLVLAYYIHHLLSKY
jgi:hypothetical protein